MTTPPDPIPATPTYTARGVHVCTGDGLFATTTDTRDALLIARALNERPMLVLAATLAREILWQLQMNYDAEQRMDEVVKAYAQCLLGLGEVAAK